MFTQPWYSAVSKLWQPFWDIALRQCLFRSIMRGNEYKQVMILLKTIHVGITGHLGYHTAQHGFTWLLVEWPAG